MELDIVEDSEQQFDSDADKVDELEELMNELHNLFQNESDVNTIVNKGSTLIKDVKYQYERGNKYLTADGVLIIV